VAWLVQHPEYINIDVFPQNENDLAVTWLTRNPNGVHYIDKTYFSQNGNDIAMKWLTQNPKFINMDDFSKNGNKYVCHYMIQNDIPFDHAISSYFYRTTKQDILSILMN
jgi:hypothetical protein